MSKYLIQITNNWKKFEKEWIKNHKHDIFLKFRGKYVVCEDCRSPLVKRMSDIYEDEDYVKMIYCTKCGQTYNSVSVDILGHVTFIKNKGGYYE